MPADKVAKPLKTLRKEVEQSGREAQWADAPKQYQEFTAVDLYMQFLKVQPGRKGQLASGYGAAGVSLGIEATFDVGNFYLPGLLSAPLTVGVEGDKTQAVVLAVHHSMPEKLAGPPPYGTNRPVSFVSMAGQGMSITVAASAGVSFVREAPELPDELKSPVSVSITELPLLLDLGTNVSAGYTYEKMHVVDAAPGWYPHSLDKDLVDDFLGIINTASKSAIKREIVTWLNKFHEKIYPLTSRAIGRASISMLNDRYMAVQKSRFYQDTSASPGRMTKLGDAIITGLGNAFPNIKKLVTNLSKLSDIVEARQSSTDELIVMLQTVRALIPGAQEIDTLYAKQFPDPGERDAFKLAMAGMHAQLNSLETRLTRAKELEQASGSGTPERMPKKGYARTGVPKGLTSYLKAGSHEAEGEASVSVKVPLVGAGAGINGKFKKSAFRYQTYSPNFGNLRNPPLVYTQDTSITYRQVEVAAGATVKVYSWETGKELLARGMTYRSACAYWPYPSGAAQTVPAMPGSGVCYGVSVRVRELVAVIKALRTGAIPALDPQVGNMIDRLAAYLRLPSTSQTLASFLEDVNPEKLQNAAGDLPSLLLEASYTFPAGKQLTVRKDDKSGAYDLFGLWNYTGWGGLPLMDGEKIDLDSIRIRARLADYRESEFAFKLTAGVPGLSTGLTLKIASVKKAGQEGVIDVWRQYYPRDVSGDRNLRVPRVALFHQ